MTNPSPLELFRANGTFVFRREPLHDDPHDADYVFAGLRRNGSDDVTPFAELTRGEQDDGWRSFDEFFRGSR